MHSGYCFFCDRASEGPDCSTCGRPVHATDTPVAPSLLERWRSFEDRRFDVQPRRLLLAAVLVVIVVYLMVFRVKWGVS